MRIQRIEEDYYSNHIAMYIQNCFKAQRNKKLTYKMCVVSEVNPFETIITKELVYKLVKQNKKTYLDSMYNYFQTIILKKYTKENPKFKHYYKCDFSDTKESNFEGAEKDVEYDINVWDIEEYVMEIAYKWKDNWMYFQIKPRHLFDDEVPTKILEKYYIHDLNDRLRKTIYKHLFQLEKENKIVKVFKKGYVGKNFRGRYYGVKSSTYWRVPNEYDLDFEVREKIKKGLTNN